MRFTKTTLSLVALSAAIALHAGVAQAGMTDAGKKAMQAAGEIMFEQRRRSCHANDPARKAYGPSLIGVIGRKAGSLEGFEYSDAMKNSGIIWNKNTLRAWMADNDGFMPGTRMRHVGIDDRTEQDFLLTYLTNLSTQ